jgi:phosphatidylinositol alpha-1,6-mannosyltransferase
MRVTLLTLDFPPTVGGVQTYLYEVSRRLGNYFDLAVVTPVDGLNPDNNAFARWVVPASLPSNFMRAFRTLKPDRVLVGHAHPRLLLPAAIAAPGRFLTVTYGNDYLAMQNHWHTPISNRLLSASRPLITISEYNAERLTNLGFPSVTIIPPGTDPTIFYPAPGRVSQTPVLLTAARLITRKGIDLVIQILPTLIREFPSLVYLIAGEGPDRSRLESIAHKYQVSESIRFIGQIPYNKMPEIYRSADIFVMPSREEPEHASIEGFGIVYLEASASGLPVVAGRSGGTTDAVRDGETGFLVPPDDRQALLTTLQRLLRQPDLRRRMGLAGRRFIEKEMNWDRAAEQMRYCIEEPGA